MRLLPLFLLLTLIGCAPVQEQPILPAQAKTPEQAQYVLPCPARNTKATWPIDDERELEVLRQFMASGDVEAFVREMGQIHPGFGFAAIAYAQDCLVVGTPV